MQLVIEASVQQDKCVIEEPQPAETAFALQKVEPWVIGPEEAQLLLTHNTHNRRVSSVVVERYATAMRSGLWEQVGDPIQLAELEDGEVVLLNGQHRLHAIVQAGVPQPLYVVTNYITRSKLDAMIRAMDQGRGRTVAHLFEALHNGALPTRERSALTAASSALAIVDVLLPHGPNALKEVTTNGRVAMAQAHPEETCWMVDLWKRCPHDLTITRGFLAGALYVHREDPRRGDAFINETLAGVMLPAGDPRLLLRQDLGRTMKRIYHGSFAKGVDAHRVWVGLVVGAWRHYQRGDCHLQHIKAIQL
jgi:hypothetical protein